MFIRHPAAAKSPRKMFSELPNFTFRDTEHLGNFGKCAPGLKSRKAADHRAMFAPVFLEDQLHHVILEVVGKIYVNVRQFVQCHAFLVEESAEIQVEADGADPADFKTVADEAVRRAASRNPFDAAPATLLEEVPGDEEIFLVTNFVDDAKFLRNQWHVLKTLVKTSRSELLFCSRAL